MYGIDYLLQAPCTYINLLLIPHLLHLMHTTPAQKKERECDGGERGIRFSYCRYNGQPAMEETSMVFSVDSGEVCIREP